MKLYNLPTYFAQSAYGEGAYGSGLYQEGMTSTTTTTTNSGGSLADTGMPVIVGGTVGVALIVCAVILFVQSRKSKNK